jgi:hypothetical protein
MRPYLKNPFTKIRLVEWLKMKVLSTNPSIAKKRKKKKRRTTNKPPNYPSRK